MKRLYEVDTYDYGVLYVWAKSPNAARSLIVRRLSLNPDGWVQEYWNVREIEKK